jgi:ATP phosphoribosyltransferase
MHRLGAADAIVDVVSTGTTLMLHGLEPIAEIGETEAVLIARRCSGDERVEMIVESVRSVVNARRTRVLLMNVPGERLRDVLEVLPSMEAPAVTRLDSEKPMWEVITAVPLDSLAEVIYEAKRRGARDIVVLSVERVVP